MTGNKVTVVPVHAIKEYRIVGTAPLILNLGIRWSVAREITNEV